MKELIYCKLNFFLTFSFHAKNKSFYNQKRGDQAVPTIVSDMVILAISKIMQDFLQEIL
jgi:hypothetical protein